MSASADAWALRVSRGVSCGASLCPCPLQPAQGTQRGPPGSSACRGLAPPPPATLRVSGAYGFPQLLGKRGLKIDCVGWSCSRGFAAQS